MKTQAVAIALVVASGVALFIGTVTAYRALVLSETRYYDQNRFAPVWVRLGRAPDAVLQEIAALPDVAAVEGRVVADAILDVPGVEEPATRLLIIPSEANTPSMTSHSPGTPVGVADEVLVNEPFAEERAAAR
jgi:putative ABC transport system permease protein